LLKYSS